MAKNLSERQNTMLGMTAAFVEAIILQPTLYWKNARARGLPFTLSPATIYRGTGASILNEMQMMGCQFFLTSSLQKHVFAGVGPSEEYLSAGVGGMLSAFISSPIELVMIQQQVYGQSFPRTVLSIARNNGVFSRTGLLRGLGPTICRDGIYVCGMLGITPVVDGYLQREHGCSPAASSFYASMIGGVCATIPSQPFDVVRKTDARCYFIGRARRDPLVPLSVPSPTFSLTPLCFPAGEDGATRRPRAGAAARERRAHARHGAHRIAARRRARAIGGRARMAHGEHLRDHLRGQRMPRPPLSLLRHPVTWDMCDPAQRLEASVTCTCTWCRMKNTYCVVLKLFKVLHEPALFEKTHRERK